MKNRYRLLATTALLALAMNTNAAVEHGSVEGGVSYAMGGIGIGERAELQAQRDEYNLWLSTAARAGNYLAGAEVRISDATTGRVVLQGRIDGPWLFADLPGGGYRVEVTEPDSGQTLSRTVRVGRDGLHRELFHFGTARTTADAGSADRPFGR